MNNDTHIWQKGSLMSLAMLAVATGISLVSQARLREGVILLVAGFGFVMWREYLKLRYLPQARKKTS